MISPKNFYNFLIQQDIRFFTGVPDSLLKNLCFYISDHAKKNHVITANEGNAVALSIGYHLATNKIPIVLAVIPACSAIAIRMMNTKKPPVYNP